jgi:hypothetical protein
MQGRISGLRSTRPAPYSSANRGPATQSKSPTVPRLRPPLTADQRPLAVLPNPPQMEAAPCSKGLPPPGLASAVLFSPPLTELK